MEAYKAEKKLGKQHLKMLDKKLDRTGEKMDRGWEQYDERVKDRSDQAPKKPKSAKYPTPNSEQKEIVRIKPLSNEKLEERAEKAAGIKAFQKNKRKHDNLEAERKDYAEWHTEKMRKLKPKK